MGAANARDSVADAKSQGELQIRSRARRDAQAEDESPHALDCELAEDGGAFEAHRTEIAARPRRVAFVDGTMRTEARLRTEAGGR